MKLNDCILTPMQKAEIVWEHGHNNPEQEDLIDMVAKEQLNCKQLKRYIERIKRV